MDAGLSIADLTALLNKANAEIQSDQKQLVVLERRMAVNVKWRQAIQARISATQADSEPIAYGSKWDTVRSAIKQITKPRFTLLDVESEMKRNDSALQVNRERLRSTIWSLANDKKELIKQVSKGNNRQPAEFEKLSISSDEANRRTIGIADNSGQITVGALEDFIRKKNRRMKDVLIHFGVNESTVKKLFEPTSKVYQAGKGWIKIRE